MRIEYYSEEYLDLTVSDRGKFWKYERVPAAYVDEVRKLLTKGAEGKAWQILRKFQVERKGEIIRV